MKKVSLVLVVLFFISLLFASDFEKKYNLKSRVDKKHGITWYIHENDWGTNSRVYLYIGKSDEDNNCSLRVRISYYAPRELFIKEYIFTVDEEEYVLIPRNTIQIVELRDNYLRRDNVETGEMSRGICEYYDISVNQEEFDTFERISQAKTVKLKYDGTRGYERVKIHKITKKAIRDVLNAFRELMNIPD